MNSKLTSSLTSLLVISGLLVGCSSSTTTTGTGTGTPAADSGIVPGADSGKPVTTTGDSGTPTGGSCSVDTGSDACGVCIGQKCCAPVEACEKNADCVALDACLQKCPAGETPAAQQCGDACYTAHPSGAAVTDTIDDCAAANCKAPCQIQ